MLQVIYVLVFNTCVALLGRFILVKLGLWQVSSEEAKQQKLKEEISRYRKHQAAQNKVLQAAKADIEAKTQQQPRSN